MGLLSSLLILYASNEASACVASACRENGGYDSDCCGLEGSVSCAAGHDFSLRAENGCMWNSGTCCMPHSSNTPSTISTYDCATFELQIFGNTICSGKPVVAQPVPAGTCVPTPGEVLTGRYFETPYDHWGLRAWDASSVNANTGYGKTTCEASLAGEGAVTNLGQCSVADPNKGSSWKVLCAPSGYPAGSCGALEWGADYHNGAKCRHFGRRAFSKKAPELNRYGDRWEICCGEETLSTGALIGLIVGPIVGCCFCTLIVALVVVLLKKNKANNSSTTATANPVAVTVEMKAEPAVGVAMKNPISLKLEELGCGQYEAALADQGYDSLGSLQGLSKEEAGEIADDVKMKPGHKRRFVDGIAVKKTETL